MIDRLAELNRVLIAATTIATPGDLITRESVLRQCESTVIENIIPDYDLSVDFAELTGLIITKNNQILVTEIGKEFLDLNPERLYELTLDQKQMLIRNQYLSGVNRLATFQLFKCFSKVYGAQTFQWSNIDSPPLQGDLKLVEHLIQLGVLARREHILEVTAYYVDAIAILLAEGKGWSPESIDEFLLERKKIGEIAEELILIYEKERVRKAGGKVECLCINHISKLRPDAGFDIESFDGKSGIIHDRFIEVKGAKGKDTRFYMSSNEMKVAKTLKEKYWVYFVGGIDVNTGTAKNKPILYKNPAESILKNKNFKKTPSTLLIEEV
ncbi:MAG: DUF3883 domain-containing protein [archaeon]|jgi:hypothetical protein